ncbi:uncharacterized protein LOC144716056 [Wolffia australiana]
MAESTAISSSSVATQSSSGPPPHPGKHSIVTALTRPAYVFDGSNYGPWRGAFLEFLNAHSLRHHLTDPPPEESDPEYPEWSRLESAVCLWLISSVATHIMEPLSMTHPARALWLKLETMYANKSNVSRTVRLYEELFACRQGTRSLQSYYGAFEAIFTNLDVYQPLILDLDVLTRYRDELRAGAFLSGLRPELADMIRGQVLGGPRVLPTEEIFAAALRVQDNLPPSLTAQPSEISPLIASGGAPKASGKGATSRKTRNSYPPCKYCVKQSHPSEKCWKEFGKPSWALAATGGKASPTSSSAGGSSSTTSSAAGTVSLALSPSELAYIQASRASSLYPTPAPSASLASLASSLASYAGGRGSSPGASSHMTGSPSILTSYRPDTSLPDVRIADGRSCPVLGSGRSHATSSLPLQNVLISVRAGGLDWAVRMDAASTNCWGIPVLESLKKPYHGYTYLIFIAPSPTGGRYYIVFVDDYTRASWTYILKSRKEVLSRVQHFLIEIITQYDTKVKVLRTDNALEFTQKAIEELCLTHGIVHQTTCPYTSQQNGVAERKHRHLLDMVRTLLLTMKVPQYLWSDAVLTATYLVNRLPSAALGGAIPIQRLTPEVDLFSLPPRVFGCTAFVQDHTPGLSKLAPRAQKGVFVGYARNQKGYRVYFPDRHHYVTSADVTFHEDVPYFAPTQSNGDISSPALSSLPSSLPVSNTIIPALPPSLSAPLPAASSTPAPLPSDLSSEPSPPSLSSPSPPSPPVSSPPPLPPSPLPRSDLDIPIAHRKGT